MSESSTEEIVQMLRMSDTGKGLCRIAANKIERLAARITELEKQVSDAGWEAEARREQDEIARAKEWR